MNDLKQNRTRKFLPFAFCLLLFSLSAPLNIFSQKLSSDSIADSHSPAKAVLYSAILPGLGQAYNKKYWKIPVIYAGIGVLVYAIDFNQKNYSTYKDAFIKRTDGDSTTTDNYPRYTDDNLKTLFQFYRRNRDLSYILISTLYVLNILDAYVDAELFHFDVSDKLSMRSTPFIMHSLNGDKIGGLSLKIVF
jgi:hypothetical protein